MRSTSALLASAVVSNGPASASPAARIALVTSGAPTTDAAATLPTPPKRARRVNRLFFRSSVTGFHLEEYDNIFSPNRRLGRGCRSRFKLMQALTIAPG